MEEALIEKETLVLDIIQEYLEKNRYFSSRKILPFIRARFAKSSTNINETGIKAILRSLVDRNVIVEGSKLLRKEILANENRKKIFSYIMEKPGVYFNQIVKNLNLSMFTVEWHLNMLLKFNYIVKVKIDKLDAYFDLRVKPENHAIFHIISREKYQKILEYLWMTKEGATKNHLSEKLSMHPNTINKYIKKLDEYGLLFREKLSNKTIYILNEEFYIQILTEINQ